MLTVLFLCTGNTCRSPMAQIILQDKVKKANLSDKISVISAGVGSFEGQPISREAKLSLQRLGIEVKEHYSQALTKDFVKKADLILTMTKNHWYVVVKAFPFAEGKTFTLAEYCGESDDISDPFGKSESVYFWCAQQILEMVSKAFIRIKIMLNNER